MPLRPLIRSIPTVARIPHRAVLSIAGSQANEFLNGLLTSSVHEPIKPSFSAFLNAQGRVLYDVFLYTTSDSAGKSSYLLEYDSRPSETSPLISLLKRYVLRSKVKIRDVSNEYDVWAVWGDSLEETPRQWTWNMNGVVQPNWDGGRWPWGAEDHTILDRRAVGMGKRRLIRQGDLPQESSHYHMGSPEAYTLHRIIHGVPEGQVDIPPTQAFPMESNLDVMGALEFRKGCYVGQELTVRTYHTGVIRKRILPVVIHRPGTRPQETVTPSATTPCFPTNVDLRPVILSKSDENRPNPRPRGTGKLLTSHKGIGLALLRLEHVEGAERGDLGLHFETTTEAGEGSWAVSPWWPEWWPRQSS